MLSLADAACAYLEAGGFKLRRRIQGFLDMERPGTALAKGERILLWAEDRVADHAAASAEPERAQRDAREDLLLKNFELEMRAAPGATGIYLVDRRAGLSQRFVAAAKNLLGESGGIRAPVEFFDAAYKIDGADGRRVRSAIGDLLAKADRTRRVTQPFLVRRGPVADATPGAGDLVKHIEQSMSHPNQKPKLILIEGNAGSGKSVAFNALVMSLYRQFIESKRARQGGRRPVVFLPSHLRTSQVGYVDDVIAAVAETDAAGAVAADQFRWLLVNGYSVWMFDGLDEFYAGNSDFFSFLQGALSAPDSKAQFVICMRGSLMNSSKSLRDFVERSRVAGHAVEIYELAPWTPDSWRELVRLELAVGRKRAADQAVANEFVAALQSQKGLAALAQLPFYCSIMLEHFLQAGALRPDVLDTLELLVNRMIDREQGKNVFRWQDFVNIDRLSEVVDKEVAKLPLPHSAKVDTRDMIRRLLEAEGRDILFELIGSIAHRQRRMASGEASAGLSATDVRALSGLANVPFSLNAEVVQRLRTVIVQFAFFGPGREPGSIDFTHPILADYLAARYAVSVLRRELCDEHPSDDPRRAAKINDTESFKRALRLAVGTAEFVPHSLFAMYLAREIRRDAELCSHAHSVLDFGDHDQGKAASPVHIFG